MNPRRESREEAYDVIVIGSGLGGLSAAAVLARAGRKVLVIERHDRAGGYAHGFTRRKYKFDSAVHATSGCEPLGFGGGALMDDVLRLLGVRDKVEFRSVDPFYAAIFPGMRIEAPAGAQEFVAAHVEHFPGEEKGLQRLLRLLTRFNREAKRLPPDATAADVELRAAEFPLHVQYGNATVAEVLDQFLADEKLKTLITAQWGYLGLPPSRLAFARWSPMMLSFIHTGTFYAMGGFQSLIDAFSAALMKFGGELLLRVGVRRVLVEGSRAVGVQLENGQRIAADVVISNADAHMTFEELVGAEHLPSEYLRMVRGLRPSLSAITSYFATDVDMHSVEGACHEIFVLNSWSHDEAYATVLDGKPNGYVVTIPTLMDPTLAPNGEHLLIITTLIPYDLGNSWRHTKAEFLLQQQEELIQLFPELEGRFTFSEAATPRTMERYTLNTSGAIYGWEASPQQSGFNRLPRRTPIDGLYLSGHWTQPGGGMMPVLVSGVQTAQMLLGFPDVNSLLASEPASMSTAR